MCYNCITMRLFDDQITPKTASLGQNQASLRIFRLRSQCSPGPWSYDRYIGCPRSSHIRRTRRLRRFRCHCLRVLRLPALISIDRPSPFGPRGRIARLWFFHALQWSCIKSSLHEVFGRAWCVEPAVLQHLIRKHTFFWVAVEHWQHKAFEKLSLFFIEAIPTSKASYLAIITSLRLQFCSFGILAKLPYFEKYFLAFAPLTVNFLGNLPKSYIICARWSSFLPKLSFWSFLGLKSSYPVNISKVIHAKDHISALRLYLEPVSTSGPLYCLVWISVAKWWCSQQAFPRSAILTLNPFSSLGPLSRTSLVWKAEKSSAILFWALGFLTLTFSTGFSCFSSTFAEISLAFS